jgi:hypothetical protein
MEQVEEIYGDVLGKLQEIRYASFSILFTKSSEIIVQ